MESDYGKQMSSAISAVLEMQEDCIRLFRDLDKALKDLVPLLGTAVTTGMGTTINKKELYIAQYLFRLYSPPKAKHRVLGVNICFHDHPKRRFPEPLFIAANTEYDAAAAEAELLQRAWDPWSAYLDWNSDKAWGKSITVTPQRSSILKITVAAVPLYSINTIEAAVGVAHSAVSRSTFLLIPPEWDRRP